MLAGMWPRPSGRTGLGRAGLRGARPTRKWAWRPCVRVGPSRPGSRSPLSTATAATARGDAGWGWPGSGPSPRAWGPGPTSEGRPGRRQAQVVDLPQPSSRWVEAGTVGFPWLRTRLCHCSTRCHSRFRTSGCNRTRSRWVSSSSPIPRMCRPTVRCICMTHCGWSRPVTSRAGP